MQHALSKMADRNQTKKAAAAGAPLCQVWTVHFTPPIGVINKLRVVDFDNAAVHDGRENL